MRYQSTTFLFISAGIPNYIIPPYPPGSLAYLNIPSGLAYITLPSPI